VQLGGRAVSTDEEQATVFALASYWYETTPRQRAEALFPGRHPDYLAEWTERMRDIATAVGAMSGDTLARFTDLVVTQERRAFAREWVRANREAGL
jgi:hypothetical protein